MFVPSPGHKSYATLMHDVLVHFTQYPYDDNVLFVEWPMVHDRTVNKTPYRARIDNIRAGCTRFCREHKLNKEDFIWVPVDNQLWCRYIPPGTDHSKFLPNIKVFVVKEKLRRARALEVLEVRKQTSNIPDNFKVGFRPIKVQKRMD